MTDRLDALAARIERLALRPEEVKAGWLRLARPLLRWVGWQPSYETAALEALVAAVRRGDAPKDELRTRIAPHLAAATEELEDNVERAERVAILYGRVPVAHLAWLGRIQRVVRRLHRASLVTQVAIDPVMVAPPLAVAEAKPQGEVASEPTEARLIELQLAAIDHIIEAARQETSFLERRRRLLEAARRLLLDADAALPLAGDGVGLRKRYLAAQIVEVDRLQALGLDPAIDLLHQARSALQRGQRERLHAALVALQGFAVGAGDERLAGGAAEALAALPPAESLAASLRRSTREVFGDEIATAITGALREGRARNEERLAQPRPGEDRELAELALTYLAPGCENETMSALLAVDGCFDVGAPLSPVRVREEHVVARLVAHPTRDMVLTPARKPEDIPQAILSDPRMLLLDMAAGRLLARRYVSYERRSTERIEMVGEARIYLVDGSTSMLTDGSEQARARMRDAILVAELATLLERFRNPQRFTRVVLFYRFFTKKLWPVHRVDDAQTALAAIGEVLSTPRKGGTDIEQALVGSFSTIREARGRDPALSQAQIVLITDGQAPVDEDYVRSAREELDMPIAVSVIALGEQNPALRALVARQRARGERAFYHHLDDTTLAALCAGRLAEARSLHLDPGSPADLADDLARMLDDLAELERARHAAVMSRATGKAGDPERAGDPELEAAHAELGIGAPTEGDRARREAASRDRLAVAERFDRWFPAPESVGDALARDPDVESVLVVLGTVVEVLSTMSDDPLARQADAVDIVERLLPDARLSPLRYDDVTSQGGPTVAEALRAVRASARGDVAASA